MEERLDKNLKENKLCIGDVSLENPFLLAPLAGITDAPTRLLAKVQGAAMTYSEMVSCKGLYYKDKNTDRLLRTLKGEDKVAYQLFGSEPDMLRFATKELACRENAVYDINMGCPVPKVVKNGEGSALLKNPALVQELVAAACEGAATGTDRLKPVTVKIRMGFDEDHINAVEVAKAAMEGGAAAVAVHGRTREQYYNGKADWDIIRKVREEVGTTIIGNGDIYSGVDALAMMAYTGCDLVMIARGALGNPWIFREALVLWETLGKPTGKELYRQGEDNIRKACNEILTANNVPIGADSSRFMPVTLEEKVSMMLRHFELSLNFKGEYAAVREMRKHVGWYMKGEQGSAALRREINAITEAAKLIETIVSIGEK